MAGTWGVDERFGPLDSGGGQADPVMVSISDAGVAHDAHADRAQS